MSKLGKRLIKAAKETRMTRAFNALDYIKTPEQLDAYVREYMAQELSFVIAQLRHAYMQLKAGKVVKQEMFADGLIAPQIKRLEELTTPDG